MVVSIKKPTGPLQHQLTLEQLDEMFYWIMNPREAKFAWVINLVKLVAVAGYLWSRSRIKDESHQLEKQTYERKSVNVVREELDREDL